MFDGMDTFLSTREYAEMHSMDELSVRRMCETGRLNAVRMGGGCWLIEDDGRISRDEVGNKERRA